MSAQGFDFGVGNGKVSEGEADGDDSADTEGGRDGRGGRRDRHAIAKDEAFHLLQNARRRAVLRYLLARPDADRFVMRDVTEAVAAWEHDTSVGALTSDERQRVYISLYQSHLPKLDEHGVVAYDQSRGIVEPRPLLAALEPFLEDGLDADDALHRRGDRRGDDVGSGDGFVGAVTSLLH